VSLQIKPVSLVKLINQVSCTKIQQNFNYLNEEFRFNDNESHPKIRDCIFINNYAGNNGGAMYNNNASRPAVINSAFRLNEAVDRGGAMCNNNFAEPTIINCVFRDNYATNFGGGMYSNNSSPALINCVFLYNQCDSSKGSEGGAVANFYSSAQFTNCTISLNFAWAGSAIKNQQSDTVLKNCIVWDNNWVDVGEIYNDNASTTNIYYSCVRNVAWENGNIDKDPEFVVPKTGFELSLLSSDSPCVDTGSKDLLPADIFDIDNDGNITEPIPIDFAGHPRIDNGNPSSGTEVDMGAFELGRIQNGNTCYGNIQSAIDAAQEGDEIKVKPGVYKGYLFISKALRLHSTGGPDVTIIDGKDQYGVYTDTAVFCHADMVLEGFTIRGSVPNEWSDGTGMRCRNSSPTLIDCVFRNNKSSLNGGGLLTQGGSPSLINCAFIDNTAGSKGGGMFIDMGAPTLVNCTFCGNSAAEYGGAIRNWNASPILTNCTFTNNSSLQGGAIYNSDNSNPVLTNCILWDNIPNEIENVNCTTTVTYCNVAGGWAGEGNINADPCFVDASLADLSIRSWVSPCIDAGNNNANLITAQDMKHNPRIVDGDLNTSAVVDMGALEFKPQVYNSATGVWYHYIQAAINDAYDTHELVLEPVLFCEAINLSGKAVTIRSKNPEDSNIIAETIIDAEGYGQPAVTCDSGEGPDTVLAGLTLTGSSTNGYGGGLYNCFSSPMVKNCILESNSAKYGGGVCNNNSSPTVINCILRDNSATHGGGMYNFNNSSPVVTNCNFTYNSAEQGCGVYNLDSSPVLTNSIVWGNWPESSDQIYSSLNSSPSVTYCDIQGGCSGTGNINEYPMFADPAQGDINLGWGSPCIDSAYNSAPGLPAADLAGNPRILDGDKDNDAVADMGVYEFSPSTSGGILQVNISPSETHTEGALWRVDQTGPWFTPGEQIEVSPGYHEVEFTDLDCWSEPQRLAVNYNNEQHSSRSHNLSLRVIGNVITSVSAEYKPLLAFNIGEIPPLDAPHGLTTEFFIEADGLINPAFQIVDISVEPEGNCILDPNTGLFRYEPDDLNDRLPFEITFRVNSGEDVSEQTIEITPIPNLPPEYTIFTGTLQEMPEPDSMDYILVHEIVNESEEVLNGISRHVRSVTIAGKYITPSSNLLSLYSDNHDIRDLTIYAERLELREPLNLPETDITIYAKNFCFTDDNALIKTTPEDFRDDTGEPMEGLNGGDITIYVEAYDPGTVGLTRFEIDGSAGRNGGRPGKAGAIKSTIHSPRPFAWLNPYALKLVIAHARDAYLYGHLDEAYGVLNEYDVLLKTYMKHENYCSLPEQWQFEFEQMQQETVTLIHRIENGLDYFGNPPGWTPMLSFEVWKAAYEDEIDRAIRILYLSYRLQIIADDVNAQVEALTEGRSKLWDETNQLKNDYSSVANIIEPLKNEAQAIAAELGSADAYNCTGLLCRLKLKEAELLERADNNIEDSHKLPWWEKAIKTVTTIGTYTAAGAQFGKYGAAVGAGAGAYLSSNELMKDLVMGGDPWESATAVTDVAEQFRDIDFDLAADGCLDVFNEISDVIDIENNGASYYINNLKISSNQIADGMFDVKEALMATSLDNEEVEKELQKIKASDPVFRSLIDQVVDFTARKKVFNRQLAAAMQKISTLSNDIRNNILAIDAMNRDASFENLIIDQRTLMYVRDMERRARARLLKYHYYMAKAYEYRTLNRYEWPLDIHDVFEEIVSIAEDKSTQILSEGDYLIIRGIYDGLMSEIRDRILLLYSYEQELEIDLLYGISRLDSPEKIARLNAGETVTIDMLEMVDNGRENVRIVDMSVDSITLNSNPPYPDENNCSLSYVALKMEHSGVCSLQNGKEIYQFRYPETAKGITWESDCYVQGNIQNSTYSYAGSSMLMALLPGLSNSQVMFYSRPSLWGEIGVYRNMNLTSTCSDIEIESVTLRIKYDYKNRDNSYVTLYVKTNPKELHPYLTLSSPDKSQEKRQDGVGNFFRTYSTGSSVMVTAPDVYGNYRFSR
jgi:predicted outer membrane repeat protein